MVRAKPELERSTWMLCTPDRFAIAMQTFGSRYLLSPR